jgi:LmbE family N-acetylglucosaminyl deacetylase
LLALGAHSDDIEIGCAGTILRLIADKAVESVCWVVLSGKDARAEEARVSAEALLEGAPDRQILQPGFRDGLLPLRRGGDQGLLRGTSSRSSRT